MIRVRLFSLAMFLKVFYDLLKVIYLCSMPLVFLEGFLLYIVFEVYSVISVQLLYLCILLFLVYMWWLNWVEILQDYLGNQGVIAIFKSSLLMVSTCSGYLLAFSFFMNLY